MAFTSAPAILTQLKAQLLACTAFTGTDSNIHYPRVALTGTVAAMSAVLAVTSRGVSQRFVGVTLPSGTLEIRLYSTSAVGTLEEAAIAIASQICTDTGIENLQVTDVSEAMEADAKTQAESGYQNECTITLSYGLE